MKDGNPWIPIADLLSGFVLVFLLMFVEAALQIGWWSAEAEREREAREQAEIAREAEIVAARQRMFGQVEEEMQMYEDLGFVRVRSDAMTVELTDVSFASGSACLNPKAGAALEAIAGFLSSSDASSEQELTIYVEGHTDPEPVGGLTRACGYFENNIQLSTLRATNVREHILEHAPETWASQLAVAGYGHTRLRNTEKPKDPVNRRVELRFVWAGESGSSDVASSQHQSSGD